MYIHNINAIHFYPGQFHSHCQRYIIKRPLFKLLTKVKDGVTDNMPVDTLKVSKHTRKRLYICLQYAYENVYNSTQHVNKQDEEDDEEDE